jgi:polar amino acid transport system substrate-binding protein
LIAVLLLIVILCILVATLGYTLWANRTLETFFAGWFSRPATATATPMLPPDADVWETVRRKGKISVGVSADYPPFAYVAPDFSLQGYDIALAQEIGKRLNLPVEFTNMAFDGLLPALQLHQIDMAVSAISITPERQGLAEFSNIYYLSEDAVVTRSDATIQVTRVEDMAKYRVGVQRGSVYQTWLQNRLVLPGLMPPPYVVSFDTADAAVNALAGSAPTIDLVVMDYLPANIAIQGKPLKVIARGLNPQGYAVAVPKNSVAFRGYLNVILGMMQSDGTLTRLAREYLRIAEPPPLPTPLPLPTPVRVTPVVPPVTPAPAVCLDGMDFVADLNYADNNMTSPAIFSAGQAFQKSWRIRNVGTCTWDSRYTLTYTAANPAGSPIGGNPVSVSTVVPPGSTYDVTVSITAPRQPGRYQSFWSMRSPSGMFFGDRLWVGIDVVTPAGPTVAPTQIAPGPVIAAFTSIPSQIQQGQCVNLTWSYNTAGAARARLFRGAILILQDMPAAGAYIDCPSELGQLQYQLVVDMQAGGATTATQFVSVTPGSLPPPVTQPAPVTQPPPGPQPLIQSFSGNSTEIAWGKCVTLSWVYLGGINITSAELFRDDERIADGLDPTGSIEDCPERWGLVNYRLTITSSTAGSSSATYYVNVRSLAGGIFRSTVALSKVGP